MSRYSKYFKLNNGLEIPSLGLGTWLSKPGEVKSAVQVAIEAGYKAIDCAAVYNNEKEVGEGLEAGFKNSGVKRSEIFITSKLWNHQHHPDYVEAGLSETLRDLKTDYVDLYLMHWPQSFKPNKVSNPETRFPKENGRMLIDPTSITETWAAMEKLVDSGRAKSIGISNFNYEETETILKSCRIKPAACQMEFHLYIQQPEYVAFMDKHDIHLEAYSPLANANPVYSKGQSVPQLIEQDVVKNVAKKHGVDPSIVAIAWPINVGVTSLPKSVTTSRIRNNLKAWDLKLDEEDLKKLATLDQKLRFNDPSEAFLYTFYKKLDGKL